MPQLPLQAGRNHWNKAVVWVNTSYQTYSDSTGIAQVGKDRPTTTKPYYPNSSNPLLNHVPEHHIQMVFKHIWKW